MPAFLGRIKSKNDDAIDLSFADLLPRSQKRVSKIFEQKYLTDFELCDLVGWSSFSKSPQVKNQRFELEGR